jgi:hypothetical protein
VRSPKGVEKGGPLWVGSLWGSARLPEGRGPVRRARASQEIKDACRSLKSKQLVFQAAVSSRGEADDLIGELESQYTPGSDTRRWQMTRVSAILVALALKEMTCLPFSR